MDLHFAKERARRLKGLGRDSAGPAALVPSPRSFMFLPGPLSGPADTCRHTSAAVWEMQFERRGATKKRQTNNAGGGKNK